MELCLDCDKHVLRLVFRLLRKWLPESRELNALMIGASAWTMRCDFPERPAAADRKRRRSMHASLRSEGRSARITVRGDGRVTLSSCGREERAMGRIPSKVVPMCLTLLSKLPSDVEYATCRLGESEERQPSLFENVFEEFCRALNLHEKRPALVLHRHGDGEAVLCALLDTGASERTARALEDKGAKSVFFLANGLDKSKLRVCMQQSLTAIGEASNGPTEIAGLPTVRDIFRCPQICRRGEFACEEGICDDAYVLISEDFKEELRHSFESLTAGDDEGLLWTRLCRAVSETFELPRLPNRWTPLVERLCELAVVAVTRGLISGRAAYPLLVFEDDAFMSCVLGLFRTAPMPVVDSMSTSYLSLRGRQKVGDISEVCLKPHAPSKHYFKHVNAFREGHSVTWSYRSKSLHHRRAIVLIRLLEPAIKTLEESHVPCIRLSRPTDWTERHRLAPSSVIAVWTCACAYVRARLKRGVTEFSSWESAREALVGRGPSQDVPETLSVKPDTNVQVRLRHLFSLFQFRKFRVRKLFDLSEAALHHRICTESMKATLYFKGAARSINELYAAVVACAGFSTVVMDRDGAQTRIKLSRTDDNRYFQLSQSAL
ncbi:hypothetical protein CYMTET_47319 [Cymbomonas tetramitiformis]|uniref:Uncharacterized protein n=1 Tax=Cymbomonas tetramitiformis TaxID=36881 RepID=A0AAE0BWG1_9CHLO|nr:hypothetical protein CYMTET_47319 [Cymbomonas tetramitiformis]